MHFSLFLIGLLFVLMLDTTNIDPQNKCSNKYEKRQGSHETKSSVAGIDKINFHGIFSVFASSSKAGTSSGRVSVSS